MDLSRFSSLCSSEPYMMPCMRSSSLTDMMFFGDDMSFSMYALSAQPLSAPLPSPSSSSTTSTASSSSASSSSSSDVAVSDASALVVEEEEKQLQPVADLPQRFELDVDPNVYNVEEIITHKNRPGSQRKYLVKWEGWDSRYNSWIDAADFCTDALPQAYEEELKQQRQEARRRRRKNASDQAPPQPPRARASKRKAAAVAAPRVDRVELVRACKRQRV